MRTPSRHYGPPKPSDEPPVILTDDGGSGLYEACKKRFAPPHYKVECDARHTVWVKLADGSRSVGLSPWLLRRHTEAELLERVDTKLGALSGTAATPPR